MTKGHERYLSDPVFKAKVDEAIADLDERMASDRPYEETLSADELRERYGILTEADEELRAAMDLTAEDLARMEAEGEADADIAEGRVATFETADEFLEELG